MSDFPDMCKSQSPSRLRFLSAATLALSVAIVPLQAETSKKKSKASPTPAATPAASAAPDKIQLKDPVAVVNGEKISKAELEEAFNQAVLAAGAKAGDLTDAQKLGGYRQILDEMVIDKLITKASSGVEVSQADIDAEIKKIKGQFPSEEAFNEQLRQSGQTPEKFNESLKRVIQQRKWIESQVAGKDTVDEADAKKFYDSNTKEFENPEMVKASHILIRVDQDAPEATVKEKQAIAQKAADRAAKGEDFTALAKQLSEEPGAAEKGGDLGFFPKDRMVKEFADAAFAQQVGTTSQPVRTQFGWHVIKVTDKKPAGTMTFEEVKPQLIAYLKSSKQREAVNKVINGLHDTAKIEINLPAPPAQPQAAPETGAPAN